jgi:uncharacterized protein (DUF1778 family)
VLTAEEGDRSGSVRSQGAAVVLYYALQRARGYEMSNAQTKDHPLSLRLPQADLALIDRAAKMQGRSRTEFMRDAAVREAEIQILDRTMITMSAEGFKAFMDEIDSPATAVPEMVEKLKRKAPWEKT